MRRASTRGLELQNAWSATLLGVLLVVPWTPSTFLSAPGYRIFLDSGIPEEVWGLVFLLLGVAQLMAVLADHVVGRRISSALLGSLFGVYVAGVAAANPVSAAIPFVLPMVVGQTWAFFQARRVV